MHPLVTDPLATLPAGLARLTPGAVVREANIELARLLATDAHGEEAESCPDEAALRGRMARLRTLGCAQAQGFAFSPPLPSAELEAILRGEVLPGA